MLHEPLPPPQEALDFYAAHSALSAPGRHAGLIADLPDDPEALVAIVQNLMIYEHVAQEFYGVALAPERRAESHIRTVEEMLDRVVAHDGRPLAAPRAPEDRICGICRNFTLLAVALMREKGVPARARCGFGAYFNATSFEDHWVCEYYDAAARRWRLADPQFDVIWIDRLAIGHDVMDVPRDRFLAAGAAWTLCRSGKADPERFGIGFSGLYGLWFIAGDLVRDFAALNRAEALAWDVWGMQPEPGWQPDAAALAAFDALAALTAEPDAAFAEIRRRYAEDEGLRVPATVFNALRQVPEPFPTLC